MTYCNFISLFTVNCKDFFLKFAHNILLQKLDPENLIKKYKMYEDVPLLLEFVSSEVISAVDAMFDFKKFDAMNITSINENM